MQLKCSASVIREISRFAQVDQQPRGEPALLHFSEQSRELAEAGLGPRTREHSAGYLQDFRTAVQLAQGGERRLLASGQARGRGGALKLCAIFEVQGLDGGAL